MKIRKIGAAGLILTMVLTAGCSNNQKVDREKSTEPEAVLTGLVFQSLSDSYGNWSGPGAEKLLEETGIKLEFYSNGSENDQRLRQYMAAGTLPDLIGFEAGQRRLLLDADLLLDLDEYEELLPSVYGERDYDKAIQYIRDRFGGETGKLYLLPVEVGGKAEDEYDWMPMLQWKPYEQAGCPELGSLEDYLDVVEEMLRYKSTTPQGERVYGFSLYDGGGSYAVQEAGALSYLYGTDTGLISSLIEMDMRTGELSAVTEEDSFYQRALHFYFEANQRGLLDPDSRTQTYDSLQQKYDRGRVLFTNYSWITEGYNEEAKRTGTGVNSYVPIVARDMKIYKRPGNPTGNDWYFGISKNCQNPEKACELLNWLYNRENITYLYYHPDQLEPITSLGLSKAQAGVRGEPLRYRHVPEGEGGSAEVFEEESIDKYLRERDMVVEGSSGVNMLPDIPASVRNQCAKIGDVVLPLSWDMIYAKDEEEFEKLWESMKKKSQELGMDEVKSYYQEIWEEALEKVEEYGKEEQNT